MATLVFDIETSGVPPETFVGEHNVTWVLVGPRERALAGGAWQADWPVAFESGEVVIYAP